MKSDFEGYSPELLTKLQFDKVPSGIKDNEQFSVVSNGESFLYHSNSISILSSGSSHSWDLVERVPFKHLIGQSVSPNKDGYVFFGGKKDSEITNNFFIYRLNEWHFVYNTIKPRFYHATAFIPETNSIAISGGYSTDGVLGDITLFNLNSTDAVELKLNIPIQISYHSMVYLGNNKVCIIGGLFTNNRPNKSLFIVDLSTGEVDQLNTYLPFEFTYPVISVFVHKMLLITNGPPNYDSWFYNFEYQIWFRFIYSDQLIFPQEKGFLFIKPNFARGTILRYRDVNVFFDDLLSRNLNSTLYKFDTKAAEKELFLLNQEREAELKKSQMLAIDMKSYESKVKLITSLSQIKSFSHEISTKQQNRCKSFDFLTSEYDGNDSAIDLLGKIEKIRNELRSETAEFSKSINEIHQPIHNYNHFQVIRAPNELTHISSDPTPIIQEKAHSLAQLISDQAIQIQNLTNQLKEEKKKIGSCKRSMISIAGEMDSANDRLKKANKLKKEKLNEYIDMRIFLNNSMLADLNCENKDQNQNIEKIGVALKSVELTRSVERLNNQLKIHKRSKINKLTQLKTEIDKLLNWDMNKNLTPADGECLSRKIRTTLYDIVLWVNEAAELIGADEYINSIHLNYEESLMSTMPVEFRKATKPKTPDLSFESTTNPIDNAWQSLMSDNSQVIQDMLEKNV